MTSHRRGRAGTDRSPMATSTPRRLSYAPLSSVLVLAGCDSLAQSSARMDESVAVTPIF